MEGRHYVWRVDLPAAFELSHTRYLTLTMSTDAYVIRAPTSLRPAPLRLTSSEAHLINIPDGNRSLGGGGYGDLFRGIFTPTGCELALKRPRFSSQKPSEAETALRRFKREGEFWSQLCHLNILPFYGLMDIQNEMYLVSPWARYGDLSKFISARIRYLGLPEDEKSQDTNRSVYGEYNESKIIYGIASGIAYLHSREVVHGDVKASNVLLHHELVPVLCDFGMTKILDGFSTTSTAMKSAGSVQWMSPELLEDLPKSRESDIYAVGITIGEVITGGVPYAGMNPSLTIRAIMSGESPPFPLASYIPNGPGSLWRLSLRCREKDPAHRLTAEQLKITLAIYTRYNLGAATGYGQGAMKLCPLGHPDRPRTLASLAVAIYTRYCQSRNRPDLETAIRYYQGALELCPPGHPDRFGSLRDLAAVIFTRYDLARDPMDLDTVIQYYREALSLNSLHHPNRPNTLASLATALHTRYSQTSNRTDLDNSIRYHQEALELNPLGQHDRLCSLSNLAAAIHTRYIQDGDRGVVSQPFGTS
ncbi:hypothetical protein FRB98_006564 [Tulasnella sp. 332]|nr:hypothetical protein FRB98_006564 [Tulasnella sp. 332]